MVTTALALRESLAQERVGLAHSVSYIIYTWFTYKNKREREKKQFIHHYTIDLQVSLEWGAKKEEKKNHVVLNNNNNSSVLVMF